MENPKLSDIEIESTVLSCCVRSCNSLYFTTRGYKINENKTCMASNFQDFIQNAEAEWLVLGWREQFLCRLILLNLCLVWTTLTFCVSAYNAVLHVFCRGDGIYSCTEICFSEMKCLKSLFALSLHLLIHSYIVLHALGVTSLESLCNTRCQSLWRAGVSSRYDFFLKEMSLQD